MTKNINNAKEFTLICTLGQICKAKGISGYRISKESGIPKMTVLDLMNNKTEFRKTSLENAIKIAKVLDMSVEDLFNSIYATKMKNLK